MQRLFYEKVYECIVQKVYENNININNNSNSNIK
jgi:hypothetical protein